MSKKNYPVGLFSLAFVNAGNIILFSAISSILVLYCTQVLNISQNHAYAIYAAFGSMYYGASLLGGFLGGNYDYALSFVYGCILAILGNFFLMGGGETTMYFGLAFVIVGVGLIVPNLYCIIGKIFNKDDASRDSGFTTVYIVANAAGTIVAFISGYIVKSYGYYAVFFICAVCVLATVMIFLFIVPRLKFIPEQNGVVYKIRVGLDNVFPLLLITVGAIITIRFLLNYAFISNILLLTLGFSALLSILYFAWIEKEPVARKKLIAFFIFMVIGTVFWALYMLAPSALMMFVKNNVNRHIGQITIPAASVYSLNPGFVIITGILFNFILAFMAKKGKKFSIPGKFAVGVIFGGLGYVALVFGIYLASQGGYVGFVWIILCYFLQSIGELLIGPTSYSMVGTLCPSYLQGFMMGTFRISIGTAIAISCFLAGATTAPHSEVGPLLTNSIYAHMFGLYGFMTLVIGVLVLIFVPKFKKLWS